MRSRFYVGLFIVATVLSVRPVQAQTTAAGPYYATPSWDQKFPCPTKATCARFVVLSNWNNDAVMDRETGLVWEKEPNVFPFEVTQDWTNATFGCLQKTTGGRRGWRLPTMEELSSLFDEASSLPPGHPFVNVRMGDSDAYWSATKFPDIPLDIAYLAGFPSTFGSDLTSSRHYYWCVRGPGGANFAR